MQAVFHSFFTFFFRLLYNEFAWSYDFVARFVSVGHWNIWVTSVISDIEQSPILEIGYGPGHLQAALIKMGYYPYGIDSSKYMAGLAFQRVRGLGVLPLLVNGYAQFAPFPSHSFRTIVATFPAEYIFSEETWSEIGRLLMANGKVIVLPAAWLKGKNLPQRLAAALFRITHQVPSATPNPSSPPKAVEVIKAYGYDVSYEYREFSDSTILIIVATKA